MTIPKGLGLKQLCNLRDYLKMLVGSALDESFIRVCEQQLMDIEWALDNYETYQEK